MLLIFSIGAIGNISNPGPAALGPGTLGGGAIINKTKIEWTDYTWNPVIGCWGPGGTAEKPNRCSYCYAEKIARRFAPPKDYGGGWREKDPSPFAPTFHPERLSEPAKVKKPSKIFVCSMADLFGDWVPTLWIAAVLEQVYRNPHHTFQFLTKNPKRLEDFNPWPKNCWVGTTVTNQAAADERLPWLLRVDAPVTFVSHEPLMGATDIRKAFIAVSGGGFASWGKLKWGIIGGMTGPGAVKPDPEWVMSLADQYQKAGVPIFLKDNLGFSEQPQEWPDCGKP